MQGDLAAGADGVSDRVAVITGGGAGLGRAFSMALAQNGFTVVITGRTQVALDETAAEIRAAGGRCTAFRADVTDYAATMNVVAAVEKTLGPIALLANNAAVITPLAYEWDIDPEEWWQTMTVNVRGTYQWIRSVLPAMMARKSGRIINMTSGGMFAEHPYATAYLASKAAIALMSYNLAGALKQHGIGVFCYTPAGRSGMITTVAGAARVPQATRARFQAVLDDDAKDKTAESVRNFMLIATGRADAFIGRFISCLDAPETLTGPAPEANQYLLRRDPPQPAPSRP